MTLGAAASDAVPADALFDRLREEIAVRRRVGSLDGSELLRLDARNFGHVAATIEQAARFARVGDSLPPFGHLGLVRRTVAAALGRVLLYFFRLITVDQQRFNGLVVRALRTINESTRGLHAELHAPENALGERLVRLEEALAVRDHRLVHLEEALAARDRRLVHLEEALGARDRRLQILETAFGDRDRQLAHLESDVAEYDRRTREAHFDLDRRHERDDEMLAGQQAAVADLRAGLTIIRTQLGALQRQQAAGVAVGAQPDRPLAPRQPAPAQPLLSALVASDALRGSEASIGDRQAGYVRYFAGATDVLDVGCGRGEFLGLLRGAGIAACGVDADLDMVLRCREQGLDVACADALQYLGALPDASLGGLVSLQVIEHWPTPALIDFIQQAARTLRPGARLLIETLNPESLLVLYRWYWLDVTHERLVHPQALQYLLRAAGFHELECVFAPPPAGPLRIPPLTVAGTDTSALQPFNAATQYLNDLLYASFDYAVVARR